MPEYNVAIEKNAKLLTAEMLCKYITGKSIEALSQDIVKNKNGKYDGLYEKS